MLEDAKKAFDTNMSLRTVEDRAFYAMYHAAMEILERLELTPKTQSGAIALFGKEVVKEREIIDPKYHSMLSKYQSKRQEADYEKIFFDDRGDAEKFLSDSEDFVQTIKESLENL